MTGRFRNWLDDRLNNLKIKKKIVFAVFLLYDTSIGIDGCSDHRVDRQKRI